MNPHERDPDPTCTECGYKMSLHETDPATGEQTKCPVYREERTTPRQEPNRSPRGDY